MEKNITGTIPCDKSSPKVCGNEALCLLKKNVSSTPICICPNTGEPLLEGSTRCLMPKKSKDFKESKIRFPSASIPNLLSNGRNESKFKDTSQNTTKNQEKGTTTMLHPTHLESTSQTTTRIHEEVTMVSYTIHLESTSQSTIRTHEDEVTVSYPLHLGHIDEISSTSISRTTFKNTNEEVVVNVANSLVLPAYFWFVAVPIVLVLLTICGCLIWKCFTNRRVGFGSRKIDKNMARATRLSQKISLEDRYTRTSFPRSTSTTTRPMDTPMRSIIPMLHENSDGGCSTEVYFKDNRTYVTTNEKVYVAVSKLER